MFMLILNLVTDDTDFPQIDMEGIDEAIDSTSKGMVQLAVNPKEALHNIATAVRNPGLIMESINQEFMKNVIFGNKNTNAKFAGRLYGETILILLSTGNNESSELSELSKVKNLDEIEKVNKATKGMGNPEAHNVVNYMKLKEQYKVTELGNDVVESLRTTGKLPSEHITEQ